MEYCIVSFRKQQEEMAWRVYVSDALKLVAENTERFAGGAHMSKRFFDFIKPQSSEQLTSSQVISNIRNKIGGGHK